MSSFQILIDSQLRGAERELNFDTTVLIVLMSCEAVLHMSSLAQVFRSVLFEMMPMDFSKIEVSIANTTVDASPKSRPSALAAFGQGSNLEGKGNRQKGKGKDQKGQGKGKHKGKLSSEGFPSLVTYCISHIKPLDQHAVRWTSKPSESHWTSTMCVFSQRNLIRNKREKKFDFSILRKWQIEDRNKALGMKKKNMYSVCGCSAEYSGEIP